MLIRLAQRVACILPYQSRIRIRETVSLIFERGMALALWIAFVKDEAFMRGMRSTQMVWSVVYTIKRHSSQYAGKPVY